LKDALRILVLQIKEKYIVKKLNKVGKNKTMDRRHEPNVGVSLKNRAKSVTKKSDFPKTSKKLSIKFNRFTSV
jgi:hypothetical protein